ncbi:MAG: hypothetical protein JKY24_07825, partial [Pseudomonadales bacterium]|nr:hypothetical protein [Pseudomonadales bacterium]
MAAVITSDTLGLFGSSLNRFGNIGPGTSNIGPGTSNIGQSNIYVNATTGNLILRQQDENLIGQGIATSVVRTYNSQGQLNDLHSDYNNDNTRFSFNQQLINIPATADVNTVDSTITRIAGDG